jgi:hypothetical protein
MVSIHDIITFTLWGAFFASIILTIPAVMKKSIGLLIIAIFLSSVIGILGLWSYGLWILLLTCLQIALTIGYALKVRTLGWILLFIAAIIAWINLVVIVANPFGWKVVGTL